MAMAMVMPTANANTTSRSPAPQHDSRCHTCRKRRVHCDGARPSCQICKTKRLPCAGYAVHKPLVWLAGGGKQNEQIRADALAGPWKPPRKKGRPRIERVADDDDDDKGREGDKKGQVTKDSEQTKDEENVATLAVGWSGKVLFTLGGNITRLPGAFVVRYPASARKTMDVLRYYDEEVYPSVNPISYHQTFHSMRPRSWSENVTLVLWDIVASCVDIHKSVRSQQPRLLLHHPRGRASHLELGRDVYQSKSRAFRLLNEELRNPEAQLRDMTLWCVLSLLLSATQIAAVGDWWVHFEGANKIIQMRGGLGAIFKSNPNIKSNLTYFMAADVFSATTTGVLPRADAERLLGYRPLIDDIFDQGSQTCIPCPNELFDAIIRINYLRTVTLSVGSSVCAESTAFRSAVRDLIRAILSFSASHWATERTRHCGTKEGGLPPEAEQLGFVRPTWDVWLLVARVYHAAALLYCVRSLALDYNELLRNPVSDSLSSLQPSALSLSSSSSVSYVTLRDIHLTAKHTLTENIRAIFSSPAQQPGSQAAYHPSEGATKCPSPLGKCVVWPLFIAGLEAAVDPSCLSSAATAARSDDSSCWPPMNEMLEFVCTSLHVVGNEVGTLNLRDASAFLRQEWKGTCETWWSGRLNVDGGETMRSWGEIFAGSTERYCFFM